MTRLDDLETQKDKLCVRQAQEKANLNNKIRAEKSRKKREKEQCRKQREVSYTAFQAEDESMSLRNLLKELKKIVEEKKNENTK